MKDWKNYYELKLKNFSKIFLIVLSLVVLYSITYISFAQTPPIPLPSPNPSQPPTAPATPIVPPKPVDESNIIFASCRLSILSGGVSAETKQKFVVGCVQEIFRFIIIISLLVAILNVAVEGLNKMDPTSVNKLKRNTIQNVFVGIFLLTMGWNILPALNESLNNLNFFNLPTVKYEEPEKNKFKPFEPKDLPPETAPIKPPDPNTTGGSGGSDSNAGSGGVGTAPVKPEPCVTPPFSTRAKAIGITHYKYPEAARSDLVTDNGSGKLIHKDTKIAFDKMKAAAAKENHTLTIVSGFRSINDQQIIIDGKKNAGQTDAQIFATSSDAGFSEHHTGYAVDINSLSQSFSETLAGQWLANNAKTYGFEMSFPRDNSQKVSFEPWHFRLVNNPVTYKLFCHVTSIKPSEIPGLVPSPVTPGTPATPGAEQVDDFALTNVNFGETGLVIPNNGGRQAFCNIFKIKKYGDLQITARHCVQNSPTDSGSNWDQPVFLKTKNPVQMFKPVVGKAVMHVRRGDGNVLILVPLDITSVSSCALKIEVNSNAQGQWVQSGDSGGPLVQNGRVVGVVSNSTSELLNGMAGRTGEFVWSRCDTKTKFEKDLPNSIIPKVTTPVTPVTPTPTKPPVTPTPSIPSSPPSNSKDFALTKTTLIVTMPDPVLGDAYCNVFYVTKYPNLAITARHCIANPPASEQNIKPIESWDQPVFQASKKVVVLPKPKIGKAVIHTMSYNTKVVRQVEININSVAACSAEIEVTEKGNWFQSGDSGSPIVQDGQVVGSLSYGAGDLSPKGDTLLKSSKGRIVWAQCAKN